MNFMRYSTLAKHFWIGSWFSMVETWSVKWRRHVRRPLLNLSAIIVLLAIQDFSYL